MKIEPLIQREKHRCISNYKNYQKIQSNGNYQNEQGTFYTDTTFKKTLKDDVEFFSVKDKVAQKALENSDIPGMKDVIGEFKGQVMLMFTNMSPFKALTYSWQRTKS